MSRIIRRVAALLAIIMVLSGNTPVLQSAQAIEGTDTSSITAATPADDYAISALCTAGMLGTCKVTSPWSIDGIVTTNFPLTASGNCWETTKLKVTNLGEPAVVYILDPSAYTYPEGKMMIYSSELAGGYSTTVPVSQKPTAFVVALASLADPTVILYASSVQTPTVCTQPTYEPPVRPYKMPVIRLKAFGCNQTKVVIYGRDLPKGIVHVNLTQSGFSPEDQSFPTIDINASNPKGEIKLLMPIKNVPVFFYTWDYYGTISSGILTPPRGCQTTYDPTVVQPPYGGK